MEMDYTRKFSIQNDKDPEIKKILSSVYQSLQEKGYNPINQIVGYILSEDPTYITNYNNARALIRKLDRDELLQELVEAVSARLIVFHPTCAVGDSARFFFFIAPATYNGPSLC